MVYTITPLLHADIITTTTTVHSLVGITLFYYFLGREFLSFLFSKFIFKIHSSSLPFFFLNFFSWSEIDEIDDG